MSVSRESLVSFNVNFASPFDDYSIKEVTMKESIMSPTLQTRVHGHYGRHQGVKNLDMLAGQTMTISAERPMTGQSMLVENTIMRVSERFNTQSSSISMQELVITATDNTALSNASKRVSKSWKCTEPHAIVGDVLGGCVGAPNIYLEPSTPKRTYFAENIYPYQVVSQQADVALAGGNDPSYLHYITYENIVGTHRFESLHGMTRKNYVWTYEETEKGDTDETWENPNAILKFEFPCDFDTLSDLLNGYDQNGLDQNSLLVINPFNGIHSILGGDNASCGMGGQEFDQSFTNKDSAGDEPNCEIDVEKHRLKRTARLGLLDADKVALRLVVAWNPTLHAGKMIRVKMKNKFQDGDIFTVSDDYGSGFYLITNLQHVLRTGGFCLTMIDCVSQSVGFGGSTIGR